MLDGIRNKAQSFGVKLIFGLIIVVFVFWGVGNIGGMSSDTLAVVNGEKLTVREFSKAWQRMAQAEKKNNPDVFSDDERFKQYKRMVLDEMITLRLFLQEAERLGIMVTPHELKALIDTYPVFHDDNGKFDPDRYRRFIASMDMSAGEFEKDLRDDMLRTKLMQYVALSASLSDAEARSIFDFRLEKRDVEYVLFSAEEYSKKAEISDADVAAYYESNKERFRLPARASLEYLLLTPESLAGGYPVSDEEVEELYEKNREQYKRPAGFQARQIFLESPPDDSSEPGAGEARAKARATLDEVLAKLKAGEDFASLARQYSQNPYAADLGGMLGWINAGDSGAPEIEEAVFALNPGEVTPPVRMRDGYHILRLEEKKEARDLPLDEVKAGIVAEIGAQKADAGFTNVQRAAEDGLAMGTPLAELAKTFHVEERKEEMTPQEELEKRLGVQADSRQILVDAIAAAAAGGPASTIPVPLNIAGGLAVVRINAARPSEVPPLDEVRQAATDILIADKGQLLARKAAEEALASFTGTEVPEAFKDRAEKSARPAVRVSPSVEPLGPAPELVDAVFSSSGSWLPMTYDTPKGVVIARVSKVEPVTEEEYAQYGEGFSGQYRQYWSGQAVQSFLFALHKAGKVELSLDFLDRLSLQR